MGALMGKYLLYGILFTTLLFSQDSYAQKPLPNPTVPVKVEGLELPNNVLIDNSGFTTVQAKTKGSVKWLVIANKPIKYMEDTEKNLIVLGTIPEDTDVAIFAVANINGKLTDFVGTKLTKSKNKIHKEESEPEKLDYKIRWH